jgi:hypothetical protein
VTTGLVLLALADPAHAVTNNLSYTFFQDGYSEGATVTGAFTGADLDGNGLLIHFSGSPPGGPTPPIEIEELTAWSMHFSGNSLSPAFDLALSDLYGFVYQIGSDGIGDDPAFDPTINQNLIEGVGAIGQFHFYTSGLGPNQMIGGFIGGQIDFPGGADFLEQNALDSSGRLLLVTQVPEPAAATVPIVALVALSLCERKMRRLW